MTESTHTSITTVMSSGVIQLGQEQQVRASTALPAEATGEAGTRT